MYGDEAFKPLGERMVVIEQRLSRSCVQDVLSAYVAIEKRRGKGSVALVELPSEAW